MYWFGGLCVLGLMYAIYRYGMRRGVEVTFDFFIDHIEEQGYIVNTYDEKIEVLPKYQKQWYMQRARKEF